MNLDDPDDVIRFLWLVSNHLFSNFKPGKRSEFPLDDFSLLKEANRHFKGRIKRMSQVLIKIQQTTQIQKEKDVVTFTVGAIRGRLDGALDRALSGKLRVTPDQKPELDQMMPRLKRLKESKI